MREELRNVLEALLFSGPNREALSGIDLATLGDSPSAQAVVAFARLLTGEAEGGDSAQEAAADETGGRGAYAFLSLGAQRVRAELEKLWTSDPGFREAAAEAARAIGEGEISRWGPWARGKLWPVFFPEGASLLGDRAGGVQELRKRRTVQLTSLSERPIENPTLELVFTSNDLLTVPHSREEISSLPYDREMKSRIRAAFDSHQQFFYDHPIHIGTPLESNEAVYGLRGLNEAVRYEKEQGRAAPEGKATVLLSLSVTHDALHEVGRDYLEAEIKRAGDFEHIRVYLFTEVECRRIVQEVLRPFLTEEEAEEVLWVFGVDGEYGRHYSFLKAIAAFWSVFIDPGVRATFKIDLDQVFPQRELEEQTGRSAFGHFATPLWGARGTDSDGKEVELGMIAGALVNEGDIHSGVFTPDVPYPEEIPAGEAAVFYNKLPMAVSTRAEMMTRYGTGTLDGRTRCIERVHVTGGTNGILVDQLRRYRPFTPSFIGRAEDQAYLMSVLYQGEGSGPLLRYVHEPGLIMRHDKEAFAGESIAAARDGRFIGDLVRTFYFTRYAEALPWDAGRTKAQLDPFTGCFITGRCYTVIMLRLVLHAAAILFAEGAEEGGEAHAASLLALAERKLRPLFEADTDGTFIGNRVQRERAAWDYYYNALGEAEESGAAQEEGQTRIAGEARRAASEIVSAGGL